MTLHIFDPQEDPHPIHKWRSLLKEVPGDGELVDLHAFHPVQGWETRYYGLYTVREPYIHPCGFQTDEGLLVLQADITAWRYSDASTQEYKRFLQQWSKEGSWGLRFVP